jgi:hypothetical protein
MMTIAIAAILLAAVARHSLLLALQAAEAQESLQRRWGATSCQRVFLEQAEDILKQVSDDPHQNADREKDPPDHATMRIVLGGMVFDLLLADENAKLNLNIIYQMRSPDEVRRVVRESADAGSRLEVRLLPLQTKSTQADEPVFDSWGEVFALNRAARDGPVPERLMSATTETTCWGDGRLNILRATEWRIRRLCRYLLAPATVDHLLQWRREYFAGQQEARRQSAAGQQASQANANNPTAAVNRTDQDCLAALVQLGLGQNEEQQIGALLTCRSTCHSLWLTVTEGQRTWCSCTVLNAAGRPKPVYSRAVWQ